MAERTWDARAKLAHYQLSGLYSISARLAATIDGGAQLPSHLPDEGARARQPASSSLVQSEEPAERPGVRNPRAVEATVFVEAPAITVFGTEPMEPEPPIVILQRQ
jgi:hypothetical protein